jgi:hypothetical protein
MTNTKAITATSTTTITATRDPGALEARAGPPAATPVAAAEAAGAGNGADGEAGDGWPAATSAGPSSRL